MARPLRPLVAGGVYHAMARGNQKAAIYHDADDRELFLRILAYVVDRFDWRCLSYCLMDNHFHLLLRTPQPTLSRGFQVLKSTYAQKFNARHDRVGHLFGGRYRAVLIQQDAHLLEVFRYVAQNPVEAHLCREPGAWAWSAHAALAGRASAPPFLALAEARSHFARRAADYERFAERLGPSAYDPADGVVFGDDAFKRTVLPDMRPDPEIVERDWGEGRPPLDDVLQTTPGVTGIALAYRTYGYTQSAIADALGCHRATISRKLRGFESA